MFVSNLGSFCLSFVDFWFCNCGAFGLAFVALLGQLGCSWSILRHVFAWQTILSRSLCMWLGCAPAVPSRASRLKEGDIPNKEGLPHYVPHIHQKRGDSTTPPPNIHQNRGGKLTPKSHNPPTCLETLTPEGQIFKTIIHSCLCQLLEAGEGHPAPSPALQELDSQH